MKTGPENFGVLVATALGILAGSGPDTLAGWTEQDLEAELLPAVVEVRGAAIVMPMFGSETDAPSFYRRPADPPLRIPLRDGEILYVGQDFDEFAGLLVYRREDGPALCR